MSLKLASVSEIYRHRKEWLELNGKQIITAQLISRVPIDLFVAIKTNTEEGEHISSHYLCCTLVITIG